MIDGSTEPSAITGDVTCFDNPNPNASPFDNKTAIVQGDICKIGDHTGQCSGKGDCPDTGVCDAGLEENAEGCQDAMNACQTGLYCNGNKCEKTLEATKDCSAEGAAESCEFGTTCMEVITQGETPTTTTTCVQWFSVENGNQITAKSVTAGTIGNFCKSGHSFEKEGKTYCMPASKTTEDVTVAQTDCNVSKFEDPTKLEEATAVKNTGKCGFNADDKKYCPSQLGDKPVQDIISEVVPKLTAQVGKCNANSISRFGSVVSKEAIACSVLAETFDEDLAMKAQLQLPFLKNTDQGWANVANNPDCAKHTILYNFYGAYSTALVASVAAGVLSFMI